MNILDENFPESQHRLLESWRIAVRQIGVDIGYQGLKDEAVLVLLHKLRQPTFFTLDFDFYERGLRHSNYCLVYIAVADNEAATYVRKLLRYPIFNTEAKRMGSIIRVSHTGLAVWHLHAETEEILSWPT